MIVMINFKQIMCHINNTIILFTEITYIMIVLYRCVVNKITINQYDFVKPTFSNFDKNTVP